MNQLGRAPRLALGAAAVLAAVGAGAQSDNVQTVNYQVYTIPVGDSSASTANGVMFDGHYIWAAVQNPEGGVVLKITPSGGVVSTTGVGAAPDQLTFDGTNVWVTDFTSNAVSIVSSNGALIKTIPLAGSANPSGPANPEGIVFDGKSIWVANDGPYMNSVSKFDAASQTLVGTYPVGRAPDAVAFDGKYIWVANSYSANVWLLNRDTGAYVDGFTTGVFPTDLVYDGTNIWVSSGVAPSSGTGSVTKLRAAGGEVLGTFTVGNQVRGLAYDGTSVWVCNSASNTVSRLRASNVVLMGTFATGKAPRSAAFDGSKIWIANSGDNTLTIIVPPEAPDKSLQMPSDAPGIASTVVTQRAPTPAATIGQMLNLVLDVD